MVSTAVHDFSRKTVLADLDELYLVQSPYAAGDDRKTQWSDIKASLAKQTLDAGTLTANSPFTLKETWNNAAVAFAGYSIDITDTASDVTSVIQRWRVGGSNFAQVGKGGAIKATAFQTGSADVFQGVGIDATDIYMLSGTRLGWVSGALQNFTYDLILRRDAAGVLAQRDGANAQTLRVYRTFADATDYERLAFQSGAGFFQIAAETAGTGTDNIDLQLRTAGTGKFDFNGLFLGLNLFSFPGSGNNYDWNYPDTGTFRIGVSSNYTDGGSVQMFGAGHATNPGEVVFDYGSSDRVVAGSTFFIRRLDPSALTTFTKVFNLDPSGNVGLGMGQTLGWSTTRQADGGPDVWFYRAAANSLGIHIGGGAFEFTREAVFTGAMTLGQYFAAFGFLVTPSTSKQIATGAISGVNAGRYSVDTEAFAASDDLDTINATADGAIIYLRAQDSARTVVVKDGTGNLALNGDMSLDNVQDTITLMYDTTLAVWIELARSNNGA